MDNLKGGRAFFRAVPFFQRSFDQAVIGMLQPVANSLKANSDMKLSLELENQQ